MVLVYGIQHRTIKSMKAVFTERNRKVYLIWNNASWGASGFHIMLQSHEVEQTKVPWCMWSCEAHSKQASKTYRVVSMFWCFWSEAIFSWTKTSAIGNRKIFDIHMSSRLELTSLLSSWARFYKLELVWGPRFLPGMLIFKLVPIMLLILKCYESKAFCVE